MFSQFFFKVVSGKIVHLWFLAKVCRLFALHIQNGFAFNTSFFLYPGHKDKSLLRCARGVKISRLPVPKTSTALEYTMYKNIWIFAPKMDLQIQIFKIGRKIQTFEKFTKIFEFSRQKPTLKMCAYDFTHFWRQNSNIWQTEWKFKMRHFW